LATGSAPADLKNQSELLMKSGKTKKSFIETLIYGRWWLFAAGSVFTLIASYIVAAIHVHSFFPPSKQVIVLTLYTFAGPFAGLVAHWVPMNAPGSWLYGILGLFFLLLHPIKPRELTAIISLIGFLVWLLMGVVWVYVKP
jgi:hypothetical protein